MPAKPLKHGDKVKVGDREGIYIGPSSDPRFALVSIKGGHNLKVNPADLVKANA